MDRMRLNILFERYAANDLSVDELNELLIHLHLAPDDELHALLWEQWHKRWLLRYCNDARREKILQNILKQITQGESEAHEQA